MSKPLTQTYSNKGFTLIEVLIALVIFAILSCITSSVLYYAFYTRTRVNKHAERLDLVNKTLFWIQRDCAQALPRSILGDEMYALPAFRGQPDYLELTRGGMSDTNNSGKHSTLKRIAYLCKNEQLIRRAWPIVDGPQRDQFADKILLVNLSRCHFSYLNQYLQTFSQWENSISSDQQSQNIPKAIQIHLDFKQGGSLNLVFPLSVTLYGQ